MNTSASMQYKTLYKILSSFLKYLGIVSE